MSSFFSCKKFLIEIDGEDGKINEIITAALKLNVVSLKENFQILRGFTYMFAHGSFWHLFFNMWGLYLFGKLLEERLGSRGFLILYFFSGLVGAFFWIVFHWSPPQDHISVIGASGAVCGLMMAAALLFPNIRILLIIPPIPDEIAHLCHYLYVLGIVYGTYENLFQYCTFSSFGRVFRWSHFMSNYL